MSQPHGEYWEESDKTLEEWVVACHGHSITAGWWIPGEENNVVTMASKIALIHSELSEMLEGLRKGHMDEHLPHRAAEEVEAADVFIRLMDYCGARKLNIVDAVIEKMEYNLQRADHKPEARALAGGKKI